MESRSLRRRALALCLGGTVILAAGCVAEYRTVTDPCWPERYSYQARESLRAAFNAQAENGHVLDQTIWNQHFESGTDKLNEAGRAHLKYLARRLPAPDPRVYVQPAYDVEGPVLDAAALRDLNEKRVAAVQRYLQAMMALRNMPVTFEVALRDAHEPGLPARGAINIHVKAAPQPLKTEFERSREDLQRAGATQVDQSVSQKQETPVKQP